MWTLGLILTLLVSCPVSGTHLSYSIEDYTALSNSLLANYSSKIRPIRDLGQSLQMQVSLWISGINDVSDVSQKMVTTAYLRVTWIDAMITWDSVSTGIYWIQFNQVNQEKVSVLSILIYFCRQIKPYVDFSYINLTKSFFVALEITSALFIVRKYD
jgi:hypothetical protein